MALSREDFATAFRALAQKAASVKDLRRAFRAQAEAPGARRTLAQALVELGVVPTDRSDVLSPSAPFDVRRDPASLDALGEMLVADEILNEVDLEKMVLDLVGARERKSQPAVAIPKGLSRFDFGWELGRGARGTVYRARRPEAPHECAIKVYRREAFGDADRAAFVARAQSWAGRREPGLVPVYEAGEAEGQAWLAMEFVEGQSIETMVADRRLSLRRGFEMVWKVARAVAPLHAKGEAHGAISSATILVGKDDEPRLAGFGLAGKGTPSEDVFALGGVLYEIATGAPPYVGYHARELKPPSRFNPSAAGTAETVIVKALPLDPARRYPDAGALAEDLRRYLQHEPVEEPKAGPSGAATRRPAGVLVAAGVLVLAGLIAYFATRPKPGAGPEPGPEPEVRTTERRGPVGPGPEPERRPEKRPERFVPPAQSEEAKRIEEWKKKGPIGRNEERDFRTGIAQASAKDDFVALERLCAEAEARGWWDGKSRDFVHHGLAVAAVRSGDLGKALPEITQAIELSPDPLYLELRIEVLLRRTEAKKALADIDARYQKKVAEINRQIQLLGEEIKQDERKTAAYVHRGALRYYKRNYEDAARDFGMAAQCGDSKARYWLALALWKDEKKEQALEAIRGYLAAHPGDFGADEARQALAEMER